MTEHKPDCALHPNWTDETLVRGLKSCTCGADKHKPNCAVHEISYGVNPCTCGVRRTRTAVRGKPTPPASTDAEVREAREYLTDFRHSLLTTVGPEFTARIDIIFAALDKAQGEVDRYKQEMEKRT